MITVISGKDCKACDNLISALAEREVWFVAIDRDSKEGKKLTEKYGIKSIPTTIMEKGSVTDIAIGFSMKVIDDIVRFWENTKDKE